MMACNKKADNYSKELCSAGKQHFHFSGVMLPWNLASQTHTICHPRHFLLFFLPVSSAVFFSLSCSVFILPLPPCLYVTYLSQCPSFLSCSSFYISDIVFVPPLYLRTPRCLCQNTLVVLHAFSICSMPPLLPTLSVSEQKHISEHTVHMDRSQWEPFCLACLGNDPHRCYWIEHWVALLMAVLFLDVRLEVSRAPEVFSLLKIQRSLITFLVDACSCTLVLFDVHYAGK